ncbi:isoprenylcysteine carboxylmethyltransferase family protein [bacterium]|nr:isoprenylcysteine carboxylmethyltransferase family protein [bacterium]
MSVRDRWINLVYKAATGSRKIRLMLTPIVGLSFVFFTICFIILSFFIDSLLGLSDFLPVPVNYLISVPLLVVGLSLVFWSVVNFLKVKGTPVPFNPPPELVASGPYRYARNPMLGGLFTVMFGIGVLCQSISLVFFFTPLFILINVVELKLIEEPELEMRLGKPYIDYRKKTPMFFPGGKFRQSG